MKLKRSIWKFPYNPYSFFFCNSDLKILNRNVTLTSKFEDKKFGCHKGKVIGKLDITQQHLGHKFGEFFITKVLGERIAYRKRQKALLKKAKHKMKLLKKKK